MSVRVVLPQDKGPSQPSDRRTRWLEVKGALRYKLPFSSSHLLILLPLWTRLVLCQYENLTFFRFILAGSMGCGCPGAGRVLAGWPLRGEAGGTPCQSQLVPAGSNQPTAGHGRALQLMVAPLRKSPGKDRQNAEWAERGMRCMCGAVKGSPVRPEGRGGGGGRRCCR